MTDNQIGDEGAKSLGEMLKLNTRLVNLYLQSGRQQKKAKWMDVIFFLIGFSDNGIGNEGAKALGDSMKIHTVMKRLWFGCGMHLISV